MIIMPDHVHAIIWINGPQEDGDGRALINPGSGALINQGPTDQSPTDQDPIANLNSNYSPTNPTTNLQSMMANPQMVLGKIIRAWKARSTRLIHQAGYTSFAWQSRYHEHIIRHEDDLNHIREYIRNNPVWHRVRP
jgi:putative transposase